MTDFANAVDRPYAQQPQVRAAAVAVITRSGRDDVAELLDILGLGDAGRWVVGPARHPQGKGVRVYCHGCDDWHPAAGGAR